MAYEVRGATEPYAAKARLVAYLNGIVSVLGHASREASARAYCTGLLLPDERKSIEPMAARIAPAAVQAKHQSLHHVVAKAAWDDAAVLAAVRRSGHRQLNRLRSSRYPQVGPDTRIAMPERQSR